METADIIALISLAISIIGIPIGYYLGGRNIRNSTYNVAIDDLTSQCNKVFETALDIHKNSDRCESNYHLMIAHHKLLQSKCSQIKKLVGSNHYPRNELMEIKKITTDQLFSENEQQQKAAIRHLIYKLTPLIEYYEKKFY